MPDTMRSYTMGLEAMRNEFDSDKGYNEGSIESLL